MTRQIQTCRLILITAQWQLMLALLLSLLIVKTAPAQQKAGDLKLEAYALETPDKQNLTAELGKLLVSENRRKADSSPTERAFGRGEKRAKFTLLKKGT